VERAGDVIGTRGLSEGESAANQYEADRQTPAARVQDHRPYPDCGAQLRLAWPQSTISKDYEYCVQSSETLIEIAATRLMLNRLAQA
jgi:hypothetical protein